MPAKAEKAGKPARTARGPADHFGGAPMPAPWITPRLSALRAPA